MVADIIDSRAYGRTKLAVLGNTEAHAVEFLHGGIDLSALGQKREIAYQDKVLDAAAQAGKDAARAYGLQDHEDKPACYILAGGIGLGIAEKASRSRHGQSWQGLGTDVAYQEINLRYVTRLGEIGYLHHVIGLEHNTAQALQRAAADAYSAYVLDIITVHLHQAGA